MAICPPAEQPNPDPNTVPVEQPAEQDPGAIPTVAGCFPTSPMAFDCSFTPCSQWPLHKEQSFSVLSASGPRLQGPHCLFQPHHGWWRLGSDRSRPPGHGKLEVAGNLQVLHQLRGCGQSAGEERPHRLEMLPWASGGPILTTEFPWGHYSLVRVVSMTGLLISFLLFTLRLTEKTEIL